MTTRNKSVLGLVIMMALACTPVNQGETGLAELEQAIETFYAAIEAGDKNRHAEMFTDGAMMMPDDGAIISGKESIGEVVRSGDEWVFHIRNLRRAETELSGEIAYTVNEYEYTWHLVDEEPTWHPTKNVHIWRRQGDGSWKLHVDIWNGSNQ